MEVNSKNGKVQKVKVASNYAESPGYVTSDNNERNLDRMYGSNDVHLQNLEDTMLESLKYIGFGTFCAVKKGYSEKYKHNIAVKIIHKRNRTNKLYIKQYLPQEIKLWRELSLEKHENILLLKEVIIANKYLYILTDVIAYGDLQSFLLRRPISQHTCKRIANAITDAVCYCHGKGIAHRDIKPANILIGEGTTVKLADFGFATKANPVCNEYLGTQIMLAPEQCARKPYNPFSSDIWQLGLTFYIILFKNMPYKKHGKKRLMNEIKGLSNHHKGVPLPPTHDVTFDCKELISGMLTIDPLLRLTIEEIKLSPWLAMKS